MIIYNRKEIKQEHFGDGTLKAEVPENLSNVDMFSIVGSFFGAASESITWCYDNDAEIFTLNCLVDAIRDVKGNNVNIELRMPYIPHARQDRKVSGRFFTLKTFAKIINQMNFSKVVVLDPHSDVATALIDRCCQMLKPIEALTVGTVLMYPDAGAAKKYKSDTTAIIGNKKRDKDGNIVSYELLNFIEGTESVTIVDDIVSYGGTFVEAAKALRERGVKNIFLIVSHCEDNIEKGKVFEYIDKVYTTDSICHLPESDKLEYITHYNFRDVVKDED